MNKIEVKKHEPEVYKLYEYLKNNHYGKEHGIGRNELMDMLNFRWGFGQMTKRRLRYLTQQINESGELEKLISTTHCCYMCRDVDEGKLAVHGTYAMAITLFKKAKKMEKKIGMNGQMKIKLGAYYKDFVETFTPEVENE